MDNIGKKGLVIHNKFAIAQSVYISNDPVQRECIVNRIYVGPDGFMYEISDGETMKAFYEFQLREEKTVNVVD